MKASVDGKHHAEFRGETAEMDANRHAMDLASKRKLTADVKFDLHTDERFREFQHEGQWYRKHPGDNFHSPMGS